MFEIKVFTDDDTVCSGSYADTLAVAFDDTNTGYELYMTHEGTLALYTLRGTPEEYETVDESHSGFADEYGDEFTVRNIVEYMVGLFQ